MFVLDALILDALSFFSGTFSIKILYQQYPFLLLLVCFHSLMVLWQASLLFVQIKNISVNLTVNESVNKSRYKYLQKSQSKKEEDLSSSQGNSDEVSVPLVDQYKLTNYDLKKNNNTTTKSSFFNPYDRGIVNNWIEFWNTK